MNTNPTQSINSKGENIIMKKNNRRILEIIEESGIFISYKDEIAKNVVVNSNSIEFKLPTANSDWAMELFSILTYMVKKYPAYISGECLQPNTLLLVNTCTML